MKLFLISLVTVIVLFSCTKEEAEEKPHYSINEGLSKYLFNENSYWVYLDTETNNEDSISLTNIRTEVNQLGPSGPGQGPQGTLDFYEIDYHSSISGNYSEFVYSSQIAKRLLTGGLIFIEGSPGTEILNARVESNLDSMVIREEVYFDVVQIRANADQDISNNLNLYYAPEIGLIKKEILNESDTSVWELDRCNVSLFN